jgi:SAM-dependent methyltransferase
MDNLAPEYPRLYPARIRKIVPWYEELIDTVVTATTFISESRSCNCRTILEMGLGDGYLAQRLLEVSADTTVLGWEISKYVCEAVSSRLDSYCRQRRLLIFNKDINEIKTLRPHLGCCCKVVTCSLLLHDIPPDRRHDFLQNCYNILAPTGSMVLADTMLMGSEFMDQILVNDWIKSMREKGMSPSEIEEMKADDPYMFSAITEEELIGLFYQVGFKTVRTIWRHCNFAVIIASKADKNAVCRHQDNG